jgi:uncharacterized membrane protein HdeD (DUF308 family)
MVNTSLNATSTPMTRRRMVSKWVELFDSSLALVAGRLAATDGGIILAYTLMAVGIVFLAAGIARLVD